MFSASRGTENLSSSPGSAVQCECRRLDAHSQLTANVVCRQRCDNAVSFAGDAYDKDISKLLEEVPRATSAPPHLADRWPTVSRCWLWETGHRLERAYDNLRWLQGAADPANLNRGWPGIEHADIRFDEDYARFYEAYSGQRKLPPPVEGRTLYSELGLLQHKQQMLAHQGMLSSATPPPTQALLMGGGLTPGGECCLEC
jgi:hypothetical protein